MICMSDLLRVENVSDVFNGLKDSLNASAFSVDSVYGVIVLLLAVFLSIKICKSLRKSIMWWIGLVLFLEIMHVLAFSTVLGTWIPATQVIFKYDVLTMFAQWCVGTKVSEFLLLLQAYISTIVGGAFATIFHWFELLFGFMFSQIGQV